MRTLIKAAQQSLCYRDYKSKLTCRQQQQRLTALKAGTAAQTVPGATDACGGCGLQLLHCSVVVLLACAIAM